MTSTLRCLMCLLLPFLGLAQSPSTVWESINTPLPRKILGFSKGHDNIIFALTDRGIYASADTGKIWQESTTFTEISPAQNMKQAIAHNASLVILQSEGNKWTNPYDYYNQSPEDWGYRLQVFNRERRIYYGYAPYKSNNGRYNTSWAGPTLSRLTHISDNIFKYNYSFYAGENSGKSSVNVDNITYDGGITWKEIAANKSIFGRYNTRYYTFTNDKIEIYTNSTITNLDKSFSIPFTSAPKIALHCIDSTIFVFAKNGVVWRTPNEGRTWQKDSFLLANVTEVTLNIRTFILKNTSNNAQNTEGWYGLKADSAAQIFTIFKNGTTTADTLAHLQLLFNLYIGQNTEGGIMFSDDDGKTWTKRPQTPIGKPDIRAIDANKDTLMVALNQLGWFYTQNDTVFKRLPYSKIESSSSQQREALKLRSTCSNASSTTFYEFSPNNGMTWAYLEKNVPFNRVIVPNGQGWIYKYELGNGYTFYKNHVYGFGENDGIARTQLDKLVCNAYQISPTILRDTMCKSEYRLFLGDTIRQEGNFIKPIKLSNSCDSVINLNITFRKFYTYRKDTICGRDYFIFDKDTLRKAGIYTKQFTTSGGCDSTVSVALAKRYSYNNLFDKLCANATTYTYRGKTYNSPVPFFYADTLANAAANGCDSIITLTLSAITHRSYVRDSVCIGQYYVIGKDTLRNIKFLTNYYFNLVASDGCDSVVEAYFYLRTFKKVINITESICQGKSYIFNGVKYDKWGLYQFPLNNSCDTLVNLTLIVTSPIETQKIYQVNRGDTLRGALILKDTFFQEFLKTPEGCDSSVVHIVFVNKTTAIGDKENADDAINIFPNPVQDILYINLEKVNMPINQGVIYAANGQLLKNIPPSVLNNSQKGIIDMKIDDLSSGLYWLMIQTSEKKYLKRFVKL
jgi:hypothetical protein